MSNYYKAILVISHDIDFVDAIVNKTWYIGDPHLNGVHVYQLNGASDSMFQFVSESFKKVFEDRRTYENKLKSFKKRKPQPTPSDVSEFIRRNEVPIPPQPYDVRIQWEDVTVNTKPVITIQNLDFSYGTKEIFKQLSMTVFGDTRRILVGQNGAEKTTLFRIFNDEFPIDCSNGDTTVIRDPRLKIGYYNQQITDSRPLDLTPIEYLQTIDGNLSIGDCKAILGKL